MPTVHQQMDIYMLKPGKRSQRFYCAICFAFLNASMCSCGHTSDHFGDHQAEATLKPGPLTFFVNLQLELLQ